MPTADTASPAACAHALHAVISGPQDAVRDWARFRALRRPDVRFVLATHAAHGAPLTVTDELEQFVAEGAREVAAHGLWERELVGRVARFGRVAHVFSSYEARLDRADAPVAARGVNSVQLVEGPDGARRIAQLEWDRPSDERPLPAALLPAALLGAG